jgi:hypothetical protein
MSRFFFLLKDLKSEILSGSMVLASQLRIAHLAVRHAQCVAGASHGLSNYLNDDYWGTLLTILLILGGAVH